MKHHQQSTPTYVFEFTQEEYLAVKRAIAAKMVQCPPEDAAVYKEFMDLTYVGK